MPIMRLITSRVCNVLVGYFTSVINTYNRIRYVWPGRIQKIDALFYYAPGDSYSTFAHIEFEPRFVEDVLANMTSSQRQTALKTCGDNKECLFDFAVTGGHIRLVSFCDESNIKVD